MPDEDALDIKVLDLVLEPFPGKSSHRGNYLVRHLSFFTTEQKQLDQAANLVAEVFDKTWTPDHNRRRYFNSLRNNGILAGTSAEPLTTDLAKVFYDELAVAKRDTDGKLTVEQKQKLDRATLSAAVDHLLEGKPVSETMLTIIRNVQDLFETVNGENIDKIIGDDALARRIQAINIEGTEPARFFRLPDGDARSFEKRLDAMLALESLQATVPQNIAAYHEAARRVQADARFRVQTLVRAYRDLRQELGERFPYLTAALKAAKSSVMRRKAATGADAPAKLDIQQLIVSGCPGSGKSYWIEQRLNEAGAHTYRVQFHSELGFSEFVGSFKPRTLYETISAKIVSADGKAVTSGRPLIDYAFTPGPFTDALIQAYAEPDTQIAIVIEEINRGNAAAAFGELFQTLDRDDTGFSRYPVTTQADYAAYLESAGALPDGAVRLPPNLFTWASMNGADQNVHPLDTAFRRRWSYRYVGYTEPCLYSDQDRVIRYAGKEYDWEVFRKALNDRLIGLLVDEDKLVGAYFLTPRQLRSPDEILSKLFLYLWDDVLRFNRAELFADESFARVGLRWNQGSGEALTLDLSAVATLAPVQGDAPAPLEPESSLESEDASPATTADV